MQALKHKTNKKNHLSAKKHKLSGLLHLKPRSKNNKIILFVTKRPYKSITVATLLSGLVLGWALYRFRNLLH